MSEFCHIQANTETERVSTAGSWASLKPQSHAGQHEKWINPFQNAYFHAKMHRNMRKFEYREFIVPVMGTHQREMEQLSMLGSEGWDVAGTVEANGTIYFFLKRER